MYEGLYPNASRWDYAIGYDQKAWFVEVHPANTSNVKEMLKKVEWLESRLVRIRDANLLNKARSFALLDSIRQGMHIKDFTAV